MPLAPVKVDTPSRLPRRSDAVGLKRARLDFELDVRLTLVRAAFLLMLFKCNFAKRKKKKKK